MYEVKATIEGIAPILFNRFTEEAMKSLDHRETGGVRTMEGKEQEALNRVYRNGNGLYCPAANLKKSLLNGITKGNIKEGRGSARPYVEATVFIKPQEIEFGKQEPDFVHECTGRIPPKSGARVILRRPGLREGWVLSFMMVVTDDRRSSDQLRRGLEEAGLLIGLCDGRPEFGRFIVKDWEVIKNGSAKKERH
jgi:hypothetical protein